MPTVAITWQLVFTISLFASGSRSLATSLGRRRANQFRYDAPAECDRYCQSSDLTSCAPGTSINYSCSCSLGGLQAIANLFMHDDAGPSLGPPAQSKCHGEYPPMSAPPLTDSAGRAPGKLQRGTYWLDSCYDEDYVIADTDYSTIVAQATSATAAPTSISTFSASVSAPAASASPTVAPTAASQQLNLTGVLRDLDAQDFQGGVCNYFYFSLINPEYQICVGSGSAIFPSSGCSGTDCTLTTSTPKLGWGLVGEYTLPSQLQCDGHVHTVPDGLNIPDAMRAGKGSDPYYACSCGGAISSVPTFCQGVCGSVCETGLEVPTKALTCNVAYRCSGGPTYNMREINNDTCTVPKLIGTTQGNLDYILDSGGLISCSGLSESVGECPGSNPANTSGRRTCTCSGPAAGVDTCSAAQGSTDSRTTNSTGNGENSGESSSSGGASPNGALRLGDLGFSLGTTVVSMALAVVLVR